MRSGLFGIEALAREPALKIGHRRPRGFARRHIANAAVRGVSRRTAKSPVEPPRAA